MLSSFARVKPARPYVMTSSASLAGKYLRRIAVDDLPDPDADPIIDEPLIDVQGTKAASEGFFFKSKEEKIAQAVKDAEELTEKILTAVTHYQQYFTKVLPQIKGYRADLEDKIKGKTFNKAKFQEKATSKDAPTLYQKDVKAGTLDGLKMPGIGRSIFSVPLATDASSFARFNKAINEVYSETHTFAVVHMKDIPVPRIKPMYLVDSRRMGYEKNTLYSKLGYTGDADVKFVLDVTAKVLAGIEAAAKLADIVEKKCAEYVKLVKEEYTPDEAGRTKSAFARTQLATIYYLYGDIGKCTFYEFYDLYLAYADKFATCYE